ncbi:hypothetical protein [Butyrivibrio sp. WCD2001]|uniref:hypothetical protein n=1 Tax=Butyrivibrio sp. WCD2001 TaxID=1280681 RepID=UPI0004278C3A|nr:hypothetical protein [Butyrivibrio sp. WCD2001]
MTNFIDDFKNKAKKYDVISFDVFDTLITRTVPDPLMVFDIVENKAKENGIYLDNFRRLRWVAQLERGISNENIYEVYEQLQQMTEITDEQREFLFKTEIDTEKEVLIRREEVCLCFKWALASGKRVFIVSDMYLPGAVLGDILDNLDITGYEDILVSCDYRKLKSEGLYQELIKKVGKGARILHIGDNEFGDGECARKEGIETYHIDSGMAEFRRFLKEGEVPSEWRYSEEMAYLGRRIADIYNSPSNTKGRNDQLYILGYFFIGPFMLSLTKWIIDEAEKNGLEGVLFSSRDGYVPYKIFQKLKKKTSIKLDGKYFYTSRKVAVACNSSNNEVLDFLVNTSWPDLKGEKILKEKFCLPEEKILTYDFKIYENDIFRYIWDHYPEIESNSRIIKKHYLRYMGNIGMVIGRKYAFYDFISSGTCQKALGVFTPFDLAGFYAYSKDNEGYDIKPYIEKKDSWVIENYKMFEAVLLSPEPSLHGFDADGNPIFGEEKRSSKEMDAMNRVQRGILDYVDEYLNHDYNIKNENINDVSLRIIEMARMLDYSGMKELVVYDDWNIG